MDDLTSTTFDGQTFPLGYNYDAYNNTLRVPRGYTVERIVKNLKNTEVKIVKIGSMPINDDFDIDFSIKANPYDYQKEIIDYAMKTFETKSQFIIDLQTGRGKSLTALFIAKRLKKSVLIVVKDHNLLNQWYKNIVTKTDCTKNDVCVLIGMQGVNHAMNLMKPYKVYITLHASIRSMISKIGFKGFNEMLSKMNVGLKVIDEFDMEFKNIIEIDLYTAVKYNLYITATTYKNSKSEDKVFQNAFDSIECMGKEFFEHIKPNRDIIWVEFDSKPNNKERFGCYIKDNFISYHHNDYLFKKRYKLIKGMTKRFIKYYNDIREKGDICALYVEKIETCSIMFNILIELGINAKDIGIVNSSVDSNDKVAAFIKPYIITTIKSFGRGIDVGGLIYLLNYENYAGLSLFEQQSGRIGRVGGKRGVMINFTDKAFRILSKFNMKKKAHLTKTFDNVFYVTYQYDEDTGEGVNYSDEDKKLQLALQKERDI